MNDNVDRSTCYFCNEGHTEALEEHHLVPQRFNGSDEPENTVWLCGSCHNKIEELYDDEFYERLGLSVEELKQEPMDRATDGVEVEPAESQSRQIPAASPHIAYEKWLREVRVSEIEESEYEGSFGEFISRHKKEILAEYDAKKAEKDPSEQYYDGLPEYVADDGPEPIGFVYEHEEESQHPVLVVTNPHKDRIDWEVAAEKDDRTPSHKIGLPIEPFVDGESGSTGKKSIQGGLRETMDSYPSYYRLHCGYCHTAFTQHQHEDLARHLRLRHGVENPYEHSDTTFAEPTKESEILSDFNE